ncbi:MAG: Spy/CpxP family protein refolding chaperone [Chthoniobacterales bacterium]
MKPKHILPILVGVTFIGLQSINAEGTPPPKDGDGPPHAHSKADKPHGKKPMRGKFFHRKKGGRKHHPGERLAKMLNLTPEQREKAKAIMESKKPQIEAIRKEERARLKAVFDEAEAELRPILTPEQIEVLDNSKKLRESSKKLHKKNKETSQEEKSE